MRLVKKYQNPSGSIDGPEYEMDTIGVYAKKMPKFTKWWNKTFRSPEGYEAWRDRWNTKHGQNVLLIDPEGHTITNAADRPQGTWIPDNTVIDNSNLEYVVNNGQVLHGNSSLPTPENLKKEEDLYITYPLKKNKIVFTNTNPMAVADDSMKGGLGAIRDVVAGTLNLFNPVNASYADMGLTSPFVYSDFDLKEVEKGKQKVRNAANELMSYASVSKYLRDYIIPNEWQKDNPALDIALVGLDAYTLGKIIKGAKATADMFDPYTTLGGRFGYYGNAWQRFYGTMARNLGLPDKPRLPEVMRKQEGEIRPIWNGRESGHVNMTIDRPVVPHDKGGWLNVDLYITEPGAVFNSGMSDYLRSIEPSDVFVHGMPEAGIKLNPKRTTIVSGNVESLEAARRQGMSTLSSRKARKLYEKAKKADEQAEIASKKESGISLAKPGYKDRLTYLSGYWADYAKEILRLQSKRGTPTLLDILLLEDITKRKAHVLPVSVYRELFFPQAQRFFVDPAHFERPIYPNGYPLTDKRFLLLDIVEGYDFPYNKLFYDRASEIESKTPDAWLGNYKSRQK